MVLVRSVTVSDLKEGDIKLEVLRHFQNPTEGGRVGASDDVLKTCQSEFERQVGKRLISAGYRLRAQAPAGGYFIDFVVEGADDRRLAIELDGDTFHGPDRWADDVKRQKALERVGWTFWRCWASEWEADRDSVFADLARVLGQHGIAPIGAASFGGTTLVEFRIVGRSSLAPDTGSKHQRPGETAADATAESAADLEKIELQTDEANSAARGEQPALSLSDRRVAVGDAVQVRFADGHARTLTVHIVGDGSTDGRQRIAPTSPLGSAILGLRTEEEAEVFIEGKPRTVIVETILDAA
jgi:very-short-patch-repair endonuclease/transcription elongation GreA/GreB family factor